MNEDDFTSDLPEGWAETDLRSLAFRIVDGSHNPPKKADSGNPMISAKDIFNGEINLNNTRLVNENDFKREHQRTDIGTGDVLLTIVGSIGRSAVVPPDLPTFTAQRSVAVIKLAKIVPAFIHYQIESPCVQEMLRDLASGTAQKGVYLRTLSRLPIHVAPLIEQKRIVTKLEELLSGVAKAKNHLERVLQIVENFRKAVWDAACSGRLTEDWREKHPDSEPAKQLLKQVKGQLGVEGEKSDSIDLDLELPPSWILAKISEFTSKVGSGATPRGGKSSYKAEGVPLIRSQNVHFDGFRDKGIAYLDEKQAASLDAATVEKGDVLLNITGASIGRVTQAPPHMHGARVNQHVCIIRPCRVVDPVWLSCFLASPFMQDHIMKIQYGVTRQALTKGQILNFVVPIPPTEEQREIVRHVQKLFSLSVKALKRLRRATQKIEQLPQAVLAKAFSGELVPTEAELARIEGRDYETAKELLARVAKAKTAEANDKEKKKMKEQFTVKHKKQPARRPLVDVIYENPKGITPENLLRIANYTIEEIDDFYCELSNIMQEIEEVKPSGSQAKKWLINNNVLIKPKKV